MPAAAKEEMLASPNAEGIFSLAAGVAAALDTRDGANADRGEKSHQGIFSKNRRPRIGSTWLKWSGTHQDRSLAWSETMLGPTIYLYSGENLLEEVDNSGGVLARYTQGGIDEPLSELRSGTSSYYQQDGLGSTISLSSSAGALTNTYTYDSFGKVTASTGTINNPFQYTGREFDAETGQYYYRARYYDTVSGRFLNEDPISFSGGMNFFVYTGNSPATRKDPRGTDYGSVYNDRGGSGPLPIRHISDCVRDILKKYFPGLDFGPIQLYEGIPTAVTNFAAVTPGAFTWDNVIYYEPGNFDGTASGIAAIGHEVTHVQQQSGGLFPFAWNYLDSYWNNVRSGQPGDEAYQNIPAEQEATAMQNEIYNDLTKAYGGKVICKEFCK